MATDRVRLTREEFNSIYFKMRYNRLSGNYRCAMGVKGMRLPGMEFFLPFKSISLWLAFKGVNCSFSLPRLIKIKELRQV